MTTDRRDMSDSPVPGTGRLPLEGLRILDVTVVWAGPYGTMHLADWGAEVIRLESIRHFATSTRGQLARPPIEMVRLRNTGMGYVDDDPGERPWNRQAIFNTHGRNKLSVTMDLTTPEGQETLERLVASADGFLENNVTISMERLGITWERLSAINPRLIMVRMPAFGNEGPYKNYRTWGNHMEALAGHPLLRAYPDEDASRGPSGVPSDAAGGIGGALAFVMGLRHRNKTGKGILIEAPTAENFVPFLGDFVMDYSMNGRVHTQLGNGHPFLAPHNVYKCAGDERWITIACRNDDEFRTLCQEMGSPALADDPRFADSLNRYKNRRELDAEISRWTAEQDAYETMSRLQAVGVPAGMVMDESDIHNDPQVKERGFFQEVTHPEAGTHLNPTVGFQLQNTPFEIRRHAVRLGEDNEYVYKQIAGYTDEEYDNLVKLGHVGMDYLPDVN